MSPMCIAKTAGLAALAICVSSAHADSLYPSLNSEGSWSYSGEGVLAGENMSAGATGFNIDWTDPNPDHDVSLSNTITLSQTNELGGKTGHFLSFDSTFSHNGPQGEFYTYSTYFHGTFSDQYEQGQRFYFEALPDGANWGTVQLTVNGSLVKYVDFAAGETPTITWDMDGNYAGQWWGIDLYFGDEFEGATSAGKITGGIGSYVVPIPGPGIAMACVVGLAGIKRRRRR